MKLTLCIDNQTFRVDYASPHCLAIAQTFNNNQPNHFGADKAIAQPLKAGDFIGDTRQGGSCNVQTITFVPHCNGTHTESVSHIVSEPFSVGELAQNLIPATLITVIPVMGNQCHDAYLPALESSDKVISKALLTAELSESDAALMSALIIRTLPNPEQKKSQTYGSEYEPPFFTNDALKYLNEKGVQHLLVDIPSIDKMYDQGLLSNHRIFWQVPQKQTTLSGDSLTQKTITEMIYVPDTVNDGQYLLSLNIAAFESDAAPSRPIIYPLENES